MSIGTQYTSGNTSSHGEQRQRIKSLLKKFHFTDLFIEELGWDQTTNEPFFISFEAETYRITSVTEKVGFIVFLCSSDPQNNIPPHSIRAAIERQLAKRAYEHLVIFTNGRKDEQLWLWVRREQGRPITRREERFHKKQAGEALSQKLLALVIAPDEEEYITISKITGRVSQAFDMEPVTKRFYIQFKAEQEQFLKAVQGITREEDRRWYASLMLNRLMLTYFIQKKGFLDRDPEYLTNRLQKIQDSTENATFLTFYRDFLLRLFHEGFAQQQRSPEIEKLLGKVPFLNGGIFDKHELEKCHLNIQIPNEAFKQIFAFFNKYLWTFDTRPLRNDREINPDVLGYIFEQLINQQNNPSGAYYTKEDITEYITRNTIISAILEKVELTYPDLFHASGAIGRLLLDNPDRYIHDSIRKGYELPLPIGIQLDTQNVWHNPEWDRIIPEKYAKLALIGETWREMIARRQHYELLYTKLQSGQISCIDDLITYNLNIRQIMQDVIDNSEDANFILNIYHVIAGKFDRYSTYRDKSGLSILDPTCGSGAFLSAALDILEPIYESSLDRMQNMVDEESISKTDSFIMHRQALSEFRTTLNIIAEHPGRTFFILKSIIVNNLYGIDIMKEATEICRMRLFFKLLSQISKFDEIEALPDVDFNIYTGDALIGFMDMDEVSAMLHDLRSMLTSQEKLTAIKLKAQEIEQDIKHFHYLQTQVDHKGVSEYKKNVYAKLATLHEELDSYMGSQYGIDSHHQMNATLQKEQLEQWRKQKQPFHWFIKFYRPIKSGGFDVIIGNPPYMEGSELQARYKIFHYNTARCRNVYALICERSFTALAKKGHLGLIVPLSIISTARMENLQSLLLKNPRTTWLSSYDVYPAKLFEGTKQRTCILLTSSEKDKNTLFTTRYNRWKSEERIYVFSRLIFQQSFYDSKFHVIPKLGHTRSKNILQKIGQHQPALFTNKSANPSFYVHRVPYNYIKAFNFTPHFWNSVDGEKKSEDYKAYYLYDQGDVNILIATINSNLFFWWWYTLFEGYHCGKHEIQSFPIGIQTMSEHIIQRLGDLALLLMQDIKKHAIRKSCQYQKTGLVSYDEFSPRKSKHILDEIDRVLAEHYGFTDEELDFIINYDIKYRMGKGHDEGDIEE